MKAYISVALFSLILSLAGIATAGDNLSDNFRYSFGWEKYEMFDHINGKVYRISKSFTPGKLVEIDFVNGTVKVVRTFTAEEWNLMKN